MTSAISEGPLQRSVYELLTADPTLMGMVTGVADGPPESADGAFDSGALPWVVVGEMLSTQDNAHQEFGREVLFTMHVWTRAYSFAPGYAIAERVAELLDHQVDSLTVFSAPLGQRIVSVRLEFMQALRDPKPDLRHHVMRFRIQTAQI